LTRAHGCARLRAVAARPALSERERRFVEAYMGEAKGVATKAALLAGYSPKTAAKQGSRLLTKGNIQQAVTDRQLDDPAVMDRRERQELLSTIARAVDEATPNKLKAIDQLSKISGDYIDRHELTGKDGGPIELTPFVIELHQGPPPPRPA
jgi:hypothetical protein